MRLSLKKKNIWMYVAACLLMINFLLVGYIKRVEIINYLQQFGVGYHYYQNEQYDTFLKMYEMNKREANVVFLGDSITFQGAWDEFFPDVKVLNRGIGSDTSEGILNRLDEVIRHNPKAVFLMIGINDLGHYISEDEIVENVDGILRYMGTNLPECQIYLESVLPTKTIELDRIESLNLRYKELAGSCSYKCEYLDLYNLFLNEKGRINRELFREDGVHLVGDSYAIWVSAIKDIVNKF